MGCACQEVLAPEQSEVLPGEGGGACQGGGSSRPASLRDCHSFPLLMVLFIFQTS